MQLNAISTCSLLAAFHTSGSASRTPIWSEIRSTMVRRSPSSRNTHPTRSPSAARSNTISLTKADFPTPDPAHHVTNSWARMPCRKSVIPGHGYAVAIGGSVITTSSRSAMATTPPGRWTFAFHTA